jgi:hypothetical protein
MAALLANAQSVRGLGSVNGFRPAKAVSRPARMAVRAAAVSAEVPDMNKRNIMNLLLVGALGLPATSMLGPFALFFVPKRWALEEWMGRCRCQQPRTAALILGALASEALPIAVPLSVIVAAPASNPKFSSPPPSTPHTYMHLIAITAAALVVALAARLQRMRLVTM